MRVLVCRPTIPAVSGCAGGAGGRLHACGPRWLRVLGRAKRARFPNTFGACVVRRKKPERVYSTCQDLPASIGTGLVGWCVLLPVVSRAAKRYSHWLFAVLVVIVCALATAQVRSCGAQAGQGSWNGRLGFVRWFAALVFEAAAMMG